MLFGGWLLLEFIVLSFQQGTQHSYYTSAVAPAIAALTGIGAVVFYQAYRRSSRRGLFLPLAIAVTGAWAFVLLRRAPNWNPWLSWTVLGATVVAVLALAFGWLRRRGPADHGDLLTGRGYSRLLAAEGRSRLFALAGAAGLIAVLAGPAAFSATPLLRPIEGTNPTAGPSAGGGAFGAGSFRDFADFGGGAAYADRGGSGSGYGRASGGFSAGHGRAGTEGSATEGPGGTVAGGRAGAFGGTASKQLIAFLEAHRDGATWLAAVPGSSAAAEIILATGGTPVMAMGGFTGSDPAPTVAQLEQYVKQGKLHYVLTGGGGGFRGGGGTVASVTTWVKQNCTVVPASAYGGSKAAASTGTAAGVSAASAEALYRCG